ncbi:UDP-glycosyltransferase 85A2-like protein [Cinnamomum micranthum f. kanehirae]|uniref:UDP-glycosyltransferase 85A2-like protein n=1 Tax=Cinnamomum micranthum f. kanehirae TaxID=337451 RepID=A0A3S3MWW4_9MAGN|nr:UDP-glycosyltransferase 85A2-like protein [Cinnamomum micranthum f. kanehirae]
MEEKKPHVVCIPAPAQGHIHPMMQLAKLLHSRGFLITFVNTDFCHRHLLRSRGADSLECLDGFRFEIISDGLSSLGEAMEDPVGFCKSFQENCVSPIRDLLRKLHHPSDGSRVTCIIADAGMTFTLKIAEEMGIPETCDSGICQALSEPTDPNDFFFNLHRDEAQTALKASMIIFNTFDDLELEVLHAMRSMFPPRIYTIGPLSLRCRLMTDSGLNSIKSSMWKEEADCLKWLDSHEVASVIYVSFGSTTVSTPQQLTEFAWGIVNSNHPFLWVIRHDLIMGGHTNFPQDLQHKIQERGMLCELVPSKRRMSWPTLQSVCFSHIVAGTLH